MSGMHQVTEGFKDIVTPVSFNTVTPVPLATLISPFSYNYITYPGSLTTPPCTENVIWILNLQSLYVTKQQVNGDSNLLYIKNI